MVKTRSARARDDGRTDGRTYGRTDRIGHSPDAPSAPIGDGQRHGRVVMVSDSAFARGGATTLMRRAVRLLRGRGHAVTLLCGELAADASDPLGPLSETGAEVISLGQGRLQTRGALDAARTGLWNAAAHDMLARWIARNDTPDTVYHLHGWAQILSPAAVAALVPVAPRTVLHAHDFFLACPNGSYMHFPKREVCQRVPLSAGCLTTQCDKRSATQKAWRALRHGVLHRQLRQAPWGAVALIHPAMAEPLSRGGLDRQRFVTVLNPAAPFSPTRIPAEDNRRVAFVGRLDLEKGAGDLAVVAAQLGLEVTFVGEGPERARIERVLPAARITGWQAREHIAGHLQEARCLVMPSRMPEPFGLVAAEASLSGLPVILPDISLLSEGIVGEGLGLRYTHGAPGALQEALAALRDMAPSDVRSMSQRGASGAACIAQSEADWIASIEGVYQLVLAAARQSVPAV